MTDQRLLIRHYRDFYDIPRAFVVEHAGELFLFDCPFDEALDDYGSEYTVYRISDALRGGIDAIAWTDPGTQFERVAVVPTTAVTFDATRRTSISADVCDAFAPRQAKE